MTRDRYVLGIDTAGSHGSIALAVNGKAVGSEPLPPGGHSSGLSAAGKKLLAARGVGWKDLAGIAVSEGPGSFTGLRIGLAWAKGLCLGSAQKLVLVSGHEAAAHSSTGGTVTQGQRGEWVADGAQGHAAAVAELGDAKLLAGESADLVRSAPAYGRSPNARKPSS